VKIISNKVLSMVNTHKSSLSYYFRHQLLQ
jgi:hypothetical protein